MLIRPLAALAALAASLLPLAAPAAARQPAPDAIYYHGRVHTPARVEQAMAVRGGRIVALGSDKAVLALAGKRTARIDLRGGTVMPGLFDMHVHPLGGGFQQLQCTFAQGSKPAQIIAVVRQCVARAKPGEWIVGGQWQAIDFGDTPPNRQMLDAVAPDNPVFLYDISGHSAWTNSAALKAAGVGRDTPPPAEGGIIEKEPSGAPSGLLRENATALVGDKIPPATPQVTARALSRGLASLLSYGVTSLTDAMVGSVLLDAYDQLYDQGRLAQRVRGCIVYGKELGKGAAFEKVLADRARYARPRIKTDCVKLFMDGVPTESHTAAMIDPYATGIDDVSKDPARLRGLLLLPPEELNPLVARLDKLGLTIKFHSVGDRASQVALDAIARARAANGAGGPAHDLGHLTFIRAEDIARAKALNVALEYSPYLWFPQPINDDIIKAIGPARIERVWPVREGVAAGALVLAGSDWEVVPNPNPWIGIETLVTRRAPAGVRAGESFGPGEAITLRQAIDIFTINAARHMGEGARLGSLEPGKLADFIVIDRDPFEIPITEVHAIKTQQVYIGGRKVFDAAGKRE